MSVQQQDSVSSLRVGLAEDIGGLVKRLRELRGLNQTELAERLGVAAAQVSQIESGYYTPSVAVLEAILNELDARLCIELYEGGMFTDSSEFDFPPAPET